MAALSKAVEGNGPWWVKALSIYGLGGGLAIYLVVQLTTVFAADLKSHAEETRRSMERLVWLTEANCVNQADDAGERATCQRALTRQSTP